MDDFRQYEDIAKQSAIFAGRWKHGFYIVKGTHPNSSGGLLHR